jgi:endonuclease/exonuclease/phosphatase family metal-dependent hydrolase
MTPQESNTIPSKPTRSRRWRRWRVVAAMLALLALLPAALFVLNGWLLARGEIAQAGKYEDIEPAAAKANPREVTIVAYNIAKAFAHRSGTEFAGTEEVENRLRQMAEAIRAEDPDLVFLSEAMTECDPCSVDQVAFLARECGLPYWAFGENYNFGLPFYRVVGGNAILSRYPLLAEANISLTGRQPFWVTQNNRRALFASVEIGGQSIWLGSLHNDSYSIRNNEDQIRQILMFLGDRPCVLAGDFNAKPDETPIQLIRDSGLFTGEFDGLPSFPANKPDQRIDFIFAPGHWQHVGTRVIEADPSDHRPVVARFRIPME